MAVFFVAMLAGAFFIAGLACVLEASVPNYLNPRPESKTKVLYMTGFTSWAATILTILWIICSAHCEWRVKETVELEVQTVGNVQIISLPNGTTYNANELFPRVFNEGDTIKVEYYETGPYLGIYYPQERNFKVGETKEQVEKSNLP